MRMLSLAAAAALIVAGATIGQAVAQMPSSTAPVSASEDQIRQAQQQLKAAGHYTGAIDGRMGPETQQAIQKYQQQAGLQATGNLDQQTMSTLLGSSPRAGTSTMPGAPTSPGATTSPGAGGMNQPSSLAPQR